MGLDQGRGGCTPPLFPVYFIGPIRLARALSRSKVDGFKPRSPHVNLQKDREQIEPWVSTKVGGLHSASSECVGRWRWRAQVQLTNLLFPGTNPGRDKNNS